MEHDRYQKSLTKAVDKSRGLGLISACGAPRFDSPKIPKESLLPVLEEFIDLLYDRGIVNASSLNAKCIPIHDELQRFLESLGFESHLTIGSMHGNDWLYGAVSSAYLEKELVKPDIEAELRVHTWITLNDTSIVDCTGQAWCYLQMNEDQPTERCITYLAPEEQTAFRYYTPLLIGREFLFRTGSLAYVEAS